MKKWISLLWLALSLQSLVAYSQGGMKEAEEVPFSQTPTLASINSLAAQVTPLKTFKELSDLYSKITDLKGQFQQNKDVIEGILVAIEGKLQIMGADALVEKTAKIIDIFSPEGCALEASQTPGQLLIKKLTAPTVAIIVEEEKKEMGVCPVCTENLTPEISFVHHGCQHESCKDDAALYARTCLDDKSFPFHCSQHAYGNCDVESDRSDLIQMGMPEEKVAAWQLGELKKFLEQDNQTSKERHWKFCTGAHCCQAFNVGYENIEVREKKNLLKFIPYSKTHKESVPVTGFHADCDMCGSKRCLDCGGNHPQSKLCKKDERENIAFIKKMVDEGTMKKCPKCKKLIEKNAGCKHMTCKSCKHEFHWDDLKTWRGMGYFQNREEVKSTITEKEIEEILKGKGHGPTK